MSVITERMLEACFGPKWWNISREVTFEQVCGKDLTPEHSELWSNRFNRFERFGEHLSAEIGDALDFAHTLGDQTLAQNIFAACKEVMNDYFMPECEAKCGTYVPTYSRCGEYRQARSSSCNDKI